MMKSITSSKNSLSAGVRTDNLSIICVSISILLCLTIPLKRTLGVMFNVSHNRTMAVILNPTSPVSQSSTHTCRIY